MSLSHIIKSGRCKLNDYKSGTICRACFLAISTAELSITSSGDKRQTLSPSGPPPPRQWNQAWPHIPGKLRAALPHPLMLLGICSWSPLPGKRHVSPMDILLHGLLWHAIRMSGKRLFWRQESWVKGLHLLVNNHMTWSKPPNFTEVIWSPVKLG